MATQQLLSQQSSTCGHSQWNVAGKQQLAQKTKAGLCQGLAWWVGSQLTAGRSTSKRDLLRWKTRSAFYRYMIVSLIIFLQLLVFMFKSLNRRSSQLRNADAFYPKQHSLDNLLDSCRNMCTRHENQTLQSLTRHTSSGTSPPSYMLIVSNWSAIGKW